MATKESKVEKQGEQVMTPEMEALQAQIAKIIEEAKAEAKAILDNANEKAAAVASGKPVMSEEAKKAEAYWNEEIEIQLFKDAGKYKDDEYVAVNGVNCLIQRGKPVKVKRKFAEALRLSMEQQGKTADMIKGLEEDYAVNSAKLN